MESQRAPDDFLMTTADLAKMFAVTQDTIIEWIGAGKFKGHKLNNKYWRVWHSDAVAFAQKEYG